jgi:hypothetical protein
MTVGKLKQEHIGMPDMMYEKAIENLQDIIDGKRRVEGLVAASSEEAVYSYVVLENDSSNARRQELDRLLR